MWQDLLLIVALQLIYVPIYTLGTVFMVKGHTHISSVLSIFEVLIYVYGLSIVLQGEHTFIAMLVYAVSNAIGLEIGAFIESKLAIGYLTIEAHLKDKDDLLFEVLKKKGFKVTSYHSKDKTMYNIEVVTKRSLEREVEDIIRRYQPEADLVMYEPYDIKTVHPLRKRGIIASLKRIHFK